MELRDGSLETPVQASTEPLGMFLIHLSAVPKGEYNTGLEQGWPSQLFYPHRKDPHTFARP